VNISNTDTVARHFKRCSIKLGYIHIFARQATIPHGWHTIVHYDLSRSSKGNDFHVI